MSSRDRILVSVDRRSWLVTVARTPPPAFLFPNQRCQRPVRSKPNPPITPGGGEEGRLYPRSIGLSIDLRADPENARNQSAKIVWGRRGMPHQSVAIRLKARKICRTRGKIKRYSPAGGRATGKSPVPLTRSRYRPSVPPPRRRSRR